MPTEDHIDRITRDWERELPELDVRPIAAVGRLLRAAHILEREVEKELARFELTVTEFNALCALRRTGPPYRLSPKQIGVALLFSSGGLTKLLERLETRGFVRREPDPDDGRGVSVVLTEAGKQRQEEAMAAHRANEEELLSPLDMQQREALESVLRELLVAFEAGAGRVRPLAHPARLQRARQAAPPRSRTALARDTS